MSFIPYVPQYILTTEDYSPKSVVTAEHWNALFNLIISQGNYSAKTIEDLLTALPNAFIPAEDKNQPNGVAGLNAEGVLPYEVLPVVNNMVSTCVKTLIKENWVQNSQTIAVDSVTPTNIVLVSAIPEDVSPYMDSLVRCTSQGTNSLTFACDGAPVANLSVNIIVIDVVV